MRPTTPIPNGCSFTLLSCRLNYTSPQRFLSPNRTTPQMYRSPDSKKISLKQARSPGSGHQQFNHSFESSANESNTYFQGHAEISRFSEVVSINSSSQLSVVLKQNKLQSCASPIHKFGGLLATGEDSIQRSRSPLGNKLSQIERLPLMELSNESNANGVTGDQNMSKNLIMEGKEVFEKELCSTSSRVPRINLTRRVTTEENKTNKENNHQINQTSLIYKSELFASPKKQVNIRYLSPGREPEIIREKEFGQSDLGFRETYPSMGEMSSLIMDLSPREGKHCNNLYGDKNRMASPQGHSKRICPNLVNFSKKKDVSFIDKVDSSNYPQMNMMETMSVGKCFGKGLERAWL